MKTKEDHQLTVAELSLCSGGVKEGGCIKFPKWEEFNKPCLPIATRFPNW